MEDGAAHTGDTTPSSESEERPSSEDLENTPGSGAELFHDSPDLPADTHLMAQPQRRRIVPTRIQPNPIAEHQPDQLVSMVGALADHTALQEGAVQDLALYHGGTLPPEDVERVLGRPMGQGSTLGLDRYQSSIRILAQRHGVPNTPLPPAGSATQIFYPDLYMHQTGAPAPPMATQPAATMAGGYLMPPGAFTVAAAGYAASAAPGAAPPSDGRPSPQETARHRP